MSTIANLGVVLSARADGLNRVLGGAAAGIRGLQSTAHRATGYMKYLFAVAAGAGLVVLVKRSMDSIDHISKLSDRLGMATEDIVKFTHAAAIAGIGQQEMAMGLQFLARNLGYAQQGMGESVKAFTNLGIQMEALKKMSPADTFKEVAERISMLPTPAAKAAASMQIFGRSGMKLIDIFLEGRAGIEKLGAEAEKLGITFSRSQGAAVEAANDALTRMREVFTGLIQKLTIAIAPFIEAGAKMFTDWASSSDNLGKTMTDVFNSILIGLAEVGDVLRELFNKAQSFKEYWAGDMAKSVSLELEFDPDKMKNMVDKYTKEASRQREILDKALSFRSKDEIDKEYAYVEDMAKKAQSMEMTMWKLSKRPGSTIDIDPYSASAVHWNKELAKWKEIRILASKRLEDQEKKEVMATATANMNKYEDLIKGSDDLNKKLEMQVELFGQSAGAADIYGLRQGAKDLPVDMQEAFNKKLEETLGLQKQLEMLESGKKATEAATKRQEDFIAKGKSIFEETRTPLEKYETKIGELNDLLERGVLTWDTYGRAVRGAKEDLEGPGGKMDAGTFQTIRSSLVDVKGLSMGAKDPVVQKVEETNKLLGDIRDDIRETRFESEDLA